MASVSEVVLRYSAKGAQQAQRADQQVRESVQETAKTARAEAGTIKRWMSRHQSAILAIGAATTGVMAAIISASPSLSAELAQVRFGFSLLAMTIGEDVAPTLGGLGDTIIDLSDAYANLPDPIRTVISHFVMLGLAVGTLAAIAAGAQSLFAGTFVATLAGKVAGAAGTAASAIAGSTAAVIALAGIVGAAIGVFGVWILKITGVLGMVRNFGSAVGSFIGGPGTGLLLLLGTILTGGLLPLMAALGGFITGVLEGGLPEGIRRAKEALGVFGDAFGMLLDAVIEVGGNLIDSFVGGVTSTIGRVDTAIGNISDRVTSELTSLPGDALGWGRDMMDNFIQGINNRIEDVGELADDVISSVEDKLGFDLEKNDRMARRWGKDLIGEFTSGVAQAKPKLRAEVTGARRGGFGLADKGDVTSGSSSSSGGGGGNRIIFEKGAVRVPGTGDTAQDLENVIERVIDRKLGEGFDSRSRV